MDHTLYWKLTSFDDLSPDELYDIMALRQEVFVVEQDCPYKDADGLDKHAWHLMGTTAEGDLVAYSRLLPEKISFAEPSIGRILTSAQGRGQGFGKELMQRSLQCMIQLFGDVPVRIGAQTYLLKFYEEFGFEARGEEYLEDGIPHVEMLRQPGS